MKKTIELYYSDIANEVEFASEKDQKDFDTELKRILSDQKSPDIFVGWLNGHRDLNGVFRQNGEFNGDCMDDFPFDTLMDLYEDANGYIGGNGMSDDMDMWAVLFFLKRFRIKRR